MNMPHILLVDNHDSFTWNLVELLRNACEGTITVKKPEETGLAVLRSCNRVIFSPGPGVPDEQPFMFSVLEEVEKMFLADTKTVPVLGVCLGMQAIALRYGGKLYNLPGVVHGQPHPLTLRQPEHPLWKGIPDGTPVGLYHSWAVEPSSLPEELQILATTPDGTIMALAHRQFPVTGVQFHPESFMTPEGLRIMRNWLGGNRQ